MKISELKTYQKINRPSSDKFGNRVYEEIEFEKKYDPTDKNPNRRFFSKIIDLLFAIIIEVSLTKFGFIITENIFYDLLIVLGIMIFISTIMESLIGSSLGKLIFNLEVINDDCEHLTLQKSIYKNTLSFGIVFSFFFSQIAVELVDFYTEWLRKKSIYVIQKSEKNIIKKMMKAQAETTSLENFHSQL